MQQALLSAGLPPPGSASHGEGQQLYNGRVKSYNPKQGYGFLECSEAKAHYGRDVFIHKAQMGELLGRFVGPGTRLDPAALKMYVRFSVEVNRSGMPQARDVARVDELCTESTAPRSGSRDLPVPSGPVLLHIGGSGDHLDALAATSMCPATPDGSPQQGSTAPSAVAAAAAAAAVVAAVAERGASQAVSPEPFPELVDDAWASGADPPSAHEELLVTRASARGYKGKGGTIRVTCAGREVGKGGGTDSPPPDALPASYVRPRDSGGGAGSVKGPPSPESQPVHHQQAQRAQQVQQPQLQSQNSPHRGIRNRGGSGSGAPGRGLRRRSAGGEIGWYSSQQECWESEDPFDQRMQQGALPVGGGGHWCAAPGCSSRSVGSGSGSCGGGGSSCRESSGRNGGSGGNGSCGSSMRARHHPFDDSGYYVEVPQPQMQQHRQLGGCYDGQVPQQPAQQPLQGPYAAFSPTGAPQAYPAVGGPVGSPSHMPPYAGHFVAYQHPPHQQPHQQQSYAQGYSPHQQAQQLLAMQQPMSPAAQSPHAFVGPSSPGQVGAQSQFSAPVHPPTPFRTDGVPSQYAGPFMAYQPQHAQQAFHQYPQVQVHQQRPQQPQQPQPPQQQLQHAPLSQPGQQLQHLQRQPQPQQMLLLRTPEPQQHPLMSSGAIAQEELPQYGTPPSPLPQVFAAPHQQMPLDSAHQLVMPSSGNLQRSQSPRSQDEMTLDFGLAGEDDFAEPTSDEFAGPTIFEAATPGSGSEDEHSLGMFRGPPPTIDPAILLCAPGGPCSPHTQLAAAAAAGCVVAAHPCADAWPADLGGAGGVGHSV